MFEKKKLMFEQRIQHKREKNEEMKLKTLERKQIVQRSADADTKDV